MQFKLAKLAVACACTAATSAHAADGLQYKFSGFGTIAVTHADLDNADYTTTQAQPKGSGYTRSWDLGTDSRLGAQFDVGFGSQWSAAVQVMSEKRYDDSFDPELSLGFVKWRPGKGFDFRVGRLPYSTFLVSDYRKIGYSQPWARPPLEMYFLSANHIDGGDITWRTSLGNVALKTQLIGGGFNEKLAAGSLRARELVSLNVTADIGSASIRASYLYGGSFTVVAPDIEMLFAIVRSGLPANALYPGSPPLPADPVSADRFDINKDSVSYISLGATYDPGAWFVTGELGHIGQLGFSAETNEGYVTVGARIKAFTPYATAGKFKHSSIPSTWHPLIQSVISGSNSDAQTNLSMGLRWDFYKNFDLKVQVDHVSHDTGSSGTLVNVQPGFVPGGSYNVVTISTDFVF